MNLLLVGETDFVGEQRVLIRDKKRLSGLTHKPLEVGNHLPVGQINGEIGQATILRADNSGLELELLLSTPPPPPLPVVLVMALPRPKMLRRTLRSAVEAGIKSIHLINSYQVQKSYWESPLLAPDRIQECLLDGLAQCRDTLLPTVQRHKLFRPFVEDQLPALVAGHRCLVAHPAATTPCPSSSMAPTALAIGPEGGFIDFEIDLFSKLGFEAVTLGSRILRVENALPYLLGKLTEGNSHASM